jgi:hypothetical protein
MDDQTQLSINSFRQLHRNLWMYDSRYFRLFGTDITPNGCWIIAPFFVELTDICIATGKDIYNGEVIELDIMGSVQAGHEYIRYEA